VSASVAVVCLACQLHVGEPDVVDAGIAAAIHDEVRHAGRPTAFVVPVDEPGRDTTAKGERGAA
jgi:hypothetical protein